MVPWEDPDTSVAWVWTLRNRETGLTHELSVRVSWKGFSSIDEVPSTVTRSAFLDRGRSGVAWALGSGVEHWAQIIFHPQSRVGPHGSTGRREVERLADE